MPLHTITGTQASFIDTMAVGAGAALVNWTWDAVNSRFTPNDAGWPDAPNEIALGVDAQVDVQPHQPPGTLVGVEEAGSWWLASPTNSMWIVDEPDYLAVIVRATADPGMVLLSKYVPDANDPQGGSPYIFLMIDGVNVDHGSIAVGHDGSAWPVGGVVTGGEFTVNYGMPLTIVGPNGWNVLTPVLLWSGSGVYRGVLNPGIKKLLRAPDVANTGRKFTTDGGTRTWLEVETDTSPGDGIAPIALAIEYVGVGYTGAGI